MKLDIHRIKSEIAQKHMNQSQLAELLGVTKQMVSYWLKEPRHLTIATVSRIADALGIDGKDLIISDNKSDDNG